MQSISIGLFLRTLLSLSVAPRKLWWILKFIKFNLQGKLYHYDNNNQVDGWFLHQEKSLNSQLSKLRGKILNPPKQPSTTSSPPKKISGWVSLIMLNKNLLFSTLGSQITNNGRALQVDKNHNNLRCTD